MAITYTAEQVSAARAAWLLDHLDADDVAYCKREARALVGMKIDCDEDGHTPSYSEWLEVVAETVYRAHMENRARYCAEMEE